MRRDPSRYWLALLLVYFGLHTLLRIKIGLPLTAVEAHLLEAARTLHWSYQGRLPPI